MNGYPTAWRPTVRPVTDRTYRAVAVRQLGVTTAESVACDHVHRHHDTALRCARRLVKETTP
jgi:hypothetical protein